MAPPERKKIVGSCTPVRVVSLPHYMPRSSNQSSKLQMHALLAAHWREALAATPIDCLSVPSSSSGPFHCRAPGIALCYCSRVVMTRY